MSQPKSMNDLEEENYMENSDDMENLQEVGMYVLKEELKNRDNQLAKMIAFVGKIPELGPESKLLFESMIRGNCSTSANNQKLPSSQRSIRVLSEIHTSSVPLRPRAPSTPPTIASSSRAHAQVNVLSHRPVNAGGMIEKPKRWAKSGQNMRTRNRGRYGRQKVNINMSQSEQGDYIESADDMENPQEIEMNVLKEKLKNRDNQMAKMIAFVEKMPELSPASKLLFLSMIRGNCSTSANNQKLPRSQRSIRVPSEIHTSSVPLCPRTPSAPPTIASSSRKHAQVNVLSHRPVNAGEMIEKPKRWARSSQNMRTRNRGRYGRQGGRGRRQNKTVHVYIQ
ncbi:hypothetical protein PV328_004025 [Microctonus aethiopoides]|uniref:Uncharacterized protein n=1 Tax=Microctonus aethiopoides TaxID=144406 RepID=A0AA39KL48_9HYME|nr:hypothetical protein PV328_004025 [Microctonus aethiopoides]